MLSEVRLVYKIVNALQASGLASVHVYMYTTCLVLSNEGNLLLIPQARQTKHLKAGKVQW